MPVHGAKRILALKRRKARERERRYLIEGLRLCEEAVRSDAQVEQLVFARDMLDNPRLSALHTETERRGIPVQLTDRRALKGMGETQTPQGVLGVVSFGSWDRDRVLAADRPLLLLDRVRDPGNLGLILRTAEAAGAAGVFLLEGSVELHNPKAVRASMGALFRLPVFSAEAPAPLLDDLRGREIPVFAARADGPPYTRLEPALPFALLLGNEAFGVDPALSSAAGRSVSIPMSPPVESINVAVATGILLDGLAPPNPR